MTKKCSCGSCPISARLKSFPEPDVVYLLGVSAGWPAGVPLMRSEASSGSIRCLAITTRDLLELSGPHDGDHLVYVLAQSSAGLDATGKIVIEL